MQFPASSLQNINCCIILFKLEAEYKCSNEIIFSMCLSDYYCLCCLFSPCTYTFVYLSYYVQGHTVNLVICWALIFKFLSNYPQARCRQAMRKLEISKYLPYLHPTKMNKYIFELIIVEVHILYDLIVSEQ